MSTKVETQKYKLHMARQLLESISEVSNSVYYVFAGNHIPRETSEIPDIVLDFDGMYFSPYSNMQFGKRVAANDACLMIKNIPYQSNVVYSMYDDKDESLQDSAYYAIVNASAYFHVFKCLHNNRGSISTVEPNFIHVSGANTFVYQTSDGYRWKYMYSVTSEMKDKFSTSNWFPFEANNSVINSATDGAIDIIKVDGTGSGYHNYLSGTFSGSHIRVGGNPNIFQISNNIIQQTNGYYTGCLIYLSAGTGSGQYSVIEDFYSNSSGNYIVLENIFSTVPVNGTTWDITPNVQIKGYGRAVSNAVARALVNSYASNSIYRIEVINRGSGYSFATANVIANNVVGVVSPAIVRPIKAPYGGHGYDGASDLGCSSVMFHVKFNNTESNTITYTNSFQQIGLMRDPIFSNVQMNMVYVNGTFLNNETIRKINPIQCVLNATMNSSSSLITSSQGDFLNQFDEGDYVYLKESNGTSHMLTVVESISNSSTMNLVSNGFFACTETIIHHANVSSSAIFKVQSNSSLVHTSNVEGIFQTGDMIIGYSSGGFGVVNSISRSNVTKGFNTFVQMTKMTGIMSSGAFVDNEYVYQGASFATATATGRLHSMILESGTLTIYITNQTGNFVNGTVIGTTSLGVASISNIYKPEINEGSGEIMFLENISPVLRQLDETETLQINFAF